MVLNRQYLERVSSQNARFFYTLGQCVILGGMLHYA